MTDAAQFIKRTKRALPFSFEKNTFHFLHETVYDNAN